MLEVEKNFVHDLNFLNSHHSTNINFIHEVVSTFKVKFSYLSLYDLMYYFYSKEKRLLLIDKSINIQTGNSKCFDISFIKELSNDSNLDEIFLLLLPNFSLRTPLHYLLFKGEFELFNNITAKLVQNKNNKNLFNDVCINKIIDMLIYILQNVTTYPSDALGDMYCKLEYFEEEDFSSNKQNATLNIQILDNIEKIEKFLTEIRTKIESSKLYLDHLNEFNFVPKYI
jgi:hypothetical protein